MGEICKDFFIVRGAVLFPAFLHVENHSGRLANSITDSDSAANEAPSTSILVKRRRREASNACTATLEIKICARITSSASF
jgi:hypothetical protein